MQLSEIPVYKQFPQKNYVVELSNGQIVETPNLNKVWFSVNRIIGIKSNNKIIPAPQANIALQENKGIYERRIQVEIAALKKRIPSYNFESQEG